MGDKDLEIKLLLDTSQATAANQQFKNEAKKAESDVLESAKAAESGKAAASKRTSDERVGGLERAREAHDKSTDAGVTGFGKMAAASAVFQVGLSKIIELAGLVGKAVSAAGEKSQKLATGFGDRRDKDRELAALMGKTVGNDFTLDQAKFNAKVGLNQNEGRSYLTSLYNAGGAQKGKTISDKEFDQFSEQTAKYALAKGYSLEQTGDVAGTVLGFGDYNKHGDNASEVALGKVNSAAAILQKGKGDFPVLARQFSMLSSASLNEDSLKGTFQDSDEVATVISVAAEKHDAQAAELAKMAGRGLRDSENKINKLADVKPGDSFIEAFKKIGPVVDKEVQKRQATTPGFKTEDYLRENMTDEGTIDAYNVFLNKGVSGGLFKDRMDLGKENEGTAPALKVIEDSEKTEVIDRRKADAQIELAEAKKGAKNSKVDILRKQVLSELIDKGEIDTNATNIKDYLVGATSFGLLGSGESVRIDEAAQKKLIERSGGKDDQTWGDSLNLTPTAREDDLRRRMERMSTRGEDPLHDKDGAFAVTPSMEAAAPMPAAGAGGMDNKEVVQAINAQTEVMKELVKPPAAPSAPDPAVRMGTAPESQTTR